MNTEGSFATPYAHGSTHLMFLMKKAAEDEPTDYRTLTFKGAQILLSPLGHEKAPEGKTESTRRQDNRAEGEEIDQECHRLSGKRA